MPILLVHLDKAMKPQTYPCPCCGYITFAGPPGTYEFCSVCGWQDDLSQLRFAETPGGANRVSLKEAQRNFAAFGASEEAKQHRAKKSLSSVQRDATWRPIDPSRDNIEVSISGHKYHDSYPKDRTRLYYWRDNYWRR
jgi:hypothetical protein